MSRWRCPACDVLWCGEPVCWVCGGPGSNMGAWPAMCHPHIYEAYREEGHGAR